MKDYGKHALSPLSPDKNLKPPELRRYTFFSVSTDKALPQPCLQGLEADNEGRRLPWQNTSA